MKTIKSDPYATSVEILANAQISDSPEIMQLDQLDPKNKLHIATARLQGYYPVSVRWPGGQFALMFCESGTNWPSTKNILAAYKHCLKTTSIFPKGTHHE